MRVAFHSSHVVADYASGRLTVGITRADDERGITLVDEVFFSVPRDFHVHNDLVAAACMTLVGRAARAARFNFSISARCAEVLTRYYRLDEVGPVDPALAPRAPGTRVGALFSGGMDSTALVVLLRDVLGEPIRVITTDYGDAFAFERFGRGAITSDVTVATDFRDKGFDHAGRFNAAAPLLYADCLDLRWLTSGNPVTHDEHGLGNMTAGGPPGFLVQDLPYNAGGVEELHLLRGLFTPGFLRILFTYAPQLLEPSFRAAARPARQKHVTKGLMLRHLYRLEGQRPPAYLDELVFPERATRLGEDPSADLRLLYIAKFDGQAVAARIAPALGRLDLRFLDRLSLDFTHRYNTNYLPLIPKALRDPAVDALHGCGVYPYDERDWAEWEVIRRYLRRHVRGVWERA